MRITKKSIRDITKLNFLTNPLARAILICARSRPLIYSEFLQMGALITLRRRFLHNEMSENDKEIIRLTEWAIDEYGFPEVKDVSKSDISGRIEDVDGTEQRDAATARRTAATGQVH